MLCFAAAVGLRALPGRADPDARRDQAPDPRAAVGRAGVAFSLQNVQALGILLLVAVLQLLTAPVGPHGRPDGVPHRPGRADLLVADDLADDLAAAGFRLVSETGEETPGPG